MSQSRKRILIVDDQQDAIDAYNSFLTRSGYEIHSAQNCEEALERVGAISPDLLLIENRLPGGGGLGVVKTVRRTNPDIKIIVMTTDPPEEIEPKYRTLNIVGILEKPLSLELLLENVRTVLT